MPRSFLIKKHGGSAAGAPGSTAAASAGSVIRRPWSNDDDAPVAKADRPLAELPLADNGAYDGRGPFDLSVRAPKRVHSEPEESVILSSSPSPGRIPLETESHPIWPAYLPFGFPFYAFPRDYPPHSKYQVPPSLVGMSPPHPEAQPPPPHQQLSPANYYGAALSPRRLHSPPSALQERNGKEHLSYSPASWTSDLALVKDSSVSPTPSSDSESSSGRENGLTKGQSLSKGDSPRYQCTDCGKNYSTYSGLSKHRQFHCLTTQAKKSFSCKYCEKVYVSLGALKMHIRTHTLPCKCKLCGKAFSRPWLLQGHIRTHTGEKPFSCPHCSRAFADRSNLRAHLQTHSDVKKYNCKACAKTFSRMSLLLKHEDGGCTTHHQRAAAC